MRQRFVLFAFIFSITASIAFGQCPLDAFGGYTCKPSTNPSTGWFRTEKFQDRWFLVDPANNAFFMKGVFVVDAIQVADPKGRDAYKTAHAKYGTMNKWADGAMQRLKAWGFNTSAQGSWYTQPLLQQQEYQSDDGYIATKVPFTVKFPTSNYAMRNNNKLLKNPVKDFTYGINREYDTYWIPRSANRTTTTRNSTTISNWRWIRIRGGTRFSLHLHRARSISWQLRLTRAINCFQ